MQRHSPFIVLLRQDIEEKGINIIVEGLVVQEQLGQQAQALAVDLQHKCGSPRQE